MQIELLKLYATGVQDEDLKEIKELIAKYLLNKARKEAGEIWKAKGYGDKTIEKWMNNEDAHQTNRFADAVRKE